MPRFFFSLVCPEHSISDVVGEEVSGRREATRRAKEIAADLVTEQMRDGKAPAGWVEVEDEAHRPIFMLPLRAVSS